MPHRPPHLYVVAVELHDRKALQRLDVLGVELEDALKGGLSPLVVALAVVADRDAEADLCRTAGVIEEGALVPGRGRGISGRGLVSKGAAKEGGK